MRRTRLVLDDGYVTGMHYWPPASGPGRGAPVVYLHGIQSHPGWFAGSAEHLADLGYAVWQPVRRGSGDNMAGRGDAASPRQLLDDVAAACRAARDESAQRGVHLVGVSWGGKLAACFAGDRAAEGCLAPLASLTLVCPGIVPRVDASPLVKLAVACSLAVRPRAMFDIPLNDVALFTDNEPMRDYLRRDEFRLHRATARFLLAGRRLDGVLRRVPAGPTDLPTTLILASEDRIVDNDATRRLVARIFGDRLRTVVLPGCHTLEFEPDPSGLYHALAASLARAER
jgi:alpha-beta hydrolase superfamily lysophospholipase